MIPNNTRKPSILSTTANRSTFNSLTSTNSTLTQSTTTTTQPAQRKTLVPGSFLRRFTTKQSQQVPSTTMIDEQTIQQNKFHINLDFDNWSITKITKESRATDQWWNTLSNYILINNKYSYRITNNTVNIINNEIDIKYPIWLPNEVFDVSLLPLVIYFLTLFHFYFYCFFACLFGYLLFHLFLYLH